MRHSTDPSSFSHRTVQANGISVHFVEEGTGPLVILLHGFPYTWFEWRHQIGSLAKAGYRVVAPDIRGFGESGKPKDISDYTILHSAGDVVALLDALGGQRAVLVGHDLGAWVAAAAARLRPDLFPALALISTVVPPREAERPSAGWGKIEAQTGGRFYHHYFQQYGVADAQFDRNPAISLRSIYNAISGTAREQERWRLIVMPGETALDTLPDPGRAPDWLGEAALAEYVRHYVAGGFTPPLAHYRCRDLNWDLTAAWAGQPITQPTVFIGGGADPALTAMQPLYDRMEQVYPGLTRKVLLPDVGHGAPEESPDEITRELMVFLDQVLAGST